MIVGTSNIPLIRLWASRLFPRFFSLNHRNMMPPFWQPRRLDIHVVGAEFASGSFALYHDRFPDMCYLGEGILDRLILIFENPFPRRMPLSFGEPLI